MNEAEILKITEYYQRIHEIQRVLKGLKTLKEYKSIFQKEESRASLARIQKYSRRKERDISRLRASILRAKEQLAKNCTHSILLPGDCSFYYECPCCKKRFSKNEIPPGTEFLIPRDYGFWKREADINIIVFQSQSEREAKNSILKYYEPLQYEEEVVIRRLEK